MTWITTNSGKRFDFTQPFDNTFDIHDIAHALAHINRFTGHTDQPYSVAQHSVYVSNIVPPRYALAGLMHDAAEAYLGDVSAPLKALLPEYKRIEHEVEMALWVAFKIPVSDAIHPCIKAADLRMLATEKRDLVTYDGDWLALEGITPIEDRIMPWPPMYAEEMFLSRFLELTQARAVARALLACAGDES
jgi:5'-deoxynucleotidase YfbR-like HD superfamily hydrolase